MKSAFSKSWKSSKQPRKQIKYSINAPNHIKRNFMAAMLDKVLKEKYGRNSLEVRKGDEVKIMRGKFKGKKGKVAVVDVASCRIQVDGAARMKEGGEKIETWLHPSNVKIVTIEENDKRRLKSKKTHEETRVEKKAEETKAVKKVTKKAVASHKDDPKGPKKE